MSKLKIAIDGPSGVGKSTVSDDVAKALNIHHLNTGALYRSFAYGIKKLGVDYNDESIVIDSIDKITLKVDFSESGLQLNYVDDVCVNDFIFNNEIALLSSKISIYKKVRKHIVALQRKIADQFDIVLEGRDICEVVLPDANFKFFLTASAKARAERVTKMYKAKGMDISYDEVYKGLVDRDYQDSHREISPLHQAKDAILIDASEISQEEVVKIILDTVKNGLKE